MSEERYKPFLLEFAALKYSLDKFADVIWGFPVELETDCQALRDHLLNDKLSATHARWREVVTDHQIVDVRHRSGKSNVVADGLSRKFVGVPLTKGDGPEWTVCEDWEARTGLSHAFFHVAEESQYSDLLDRFRDEAVFKQVILALLELDHGASPRERRRARHRALDYFIEDGKLWKLGPGSVRARAKVECVTKLEAAALARHVHETNGHFHRDLIKVQLLDRVHSPALDQSIVAAINECGRCKNFGARHVHSLLEPITRRHPFELMVGDTLSMPRGKGGYTKLSLNMDVYSQRLWVDKLTTAASGATTLKTLGRIWGGFRRPEGYMCDGGPEFDNWQLRQRG